MKTNFNDYQNRAIKINNRDINPKKNHILNNNMNNDIYIFFTSKN